ncbi:MAG: aldose epimerase [Kiritimatiellia bacterium]
MAEESFHNRIRVQSISSPRGETRADVVPELGGIVSSLRLGGGRECLFRHEWFWDPSTPETRGGLPLLFPVCGRLLHGGVPGRYRIAGQSFVLPIHGFAMRMPWEVVDASRPDSLRLRLADSQSTRAAFPFAFELDLLYSVAPDGFSCRLTVRNSGDHAMPFYAGFHPYFATPPPKSGKEQTVFEAHPRARHLYDSTKTRLGASGPPPAFPLSVADDDLNGSLLEMGEDNETRIRFPDGFELSQTASPLFRFRQLHTLPGEPFFCDEPWMAPAGSLHRPGGARILPPGESESGTICIAPGPA